MIRNIFAECRHFAKEENIHSLRACEGGEIPHILSFIRENFTAIIDDMRVHYESRLPISSDPDAILALLRTIEPPLEEYDRNSAQAEVEALRAGTLPRRKSPLLSIIIPLLRKEREAGTPDSFSETMHKQYSYYFVQNLAKGVYSLPANENDVKKGRKTKGGKKKTAGDSTEPSKQQKEANVCEEKRTPKEAAPKEAAPKESAQKEAAPKEAAQKEAAPKEAAPKEAAPKESGPGDVKNTLALGSKPAQKALPFENTVKIAIGRSQEKDMRSDRTEKGELGPLEAKLAQKASQPVSRAEDIPESPAAPAVDDERASVPVGQKDGLPGENRQEKKSERETNEETATPVPSIVKKESYTVPDEQAIRARYLSLVYTQDTCALYWLSKVAGDRAPAPLWLCELLHYGVHLLPESPCAGRIAELCAWATARIEDLDIRQCLLLATALLRPSLMMPDLNMATLAGSLASRLSEYACTPFFRRLTQFISRGNAVEARIFVGRDSEKHRKMLYESLKTATLSFLERMKNGRMPDMAARNVRLELFSDRGLLGRLFAQCISRDFSGLSDCIDSYSPAPERILHTCIAYPRIRRNAEYPRRRLNENISEAFTLLRKWQDFSLLDNTVDDGEQPYSVVIYRELFNTFEADTGKLSEFPEGRFLVKAWIDLAECPGAVLKAEPRDLKALLDLWPLRLPFPPKVDEQTLVRFVEWLSDESRMEANVVAETLAEHMMEGELDACERFLAVFPEYESCTLDPTKLVAFAPHFQGRESPSLGEFLVFCQYAFSSAFSTTLDTVRSLVSEYGFRSVLHFSQQSQYNSRLEDIQARYGGKRKNDRAVGVRELQKIEQELRQCDADRKAEVRARIDELLGQKELSAEARERLETVCSEHLRLGMYNSAWADIVDVEEHLITGKALRSISGPSTPEATAAHDFYDLLQKKALPEGILKDEWAEAKRLLRNSPLTSPRDVAIVTKLLRWLGFTLAQTEQARSVYSAGSPNFWRVIQYTMEIAGPVPQWGSCQNRHLIVLGWNVQPEDINQLLISRYFESSDAVTILCFTAFDYEARKRLLGFCSSLHMAPLIVDTNLVNFLSKQDGEVRTDVLFRVSLAGASINPYMPDMAGAVPREIFFGREEDIRAVMAPEGPCIIYGGRQLGKGALLQQIARRDNPGVRVLLHSMTPSETSLLDVALMECRKAEIVEASTQIDTFASRVSAWLSEHMDKRILLLLDECDKALEADARQDFLDAAQFRNLMQETNRRFKVVFTGLHSVQRFSQIPNNPLYHFGEPLCIGPLSPEAANDLMRKPTAVLGLEFANDQLVQMALNHCSYQPKLIQIFCSEIVRALNERTDREPFRTIDKETILKIYESHDLKKKILECFEMTLNLDERYLVIGYTMAINHGRGFSLNQLLDELRYFWPAAFENTDDVSDVHNVLRSLLHEMEGLGLVISLGGRYRLRTPNVVELLGGEDSIYMRLDPYQTKEYRPSGNPDERRHPGFEPFVASQYNRLTERGNGLFCVSGSDALGLSSVPDALERIAQESKARIIHLTGGSVEEVCRTMRAEYEKREKCNLFFWISSRDIEQLGTFIEACDAWLTGLSNAKKVVKVVCLLHPDCLYEFIRTGLADRYSSYQLELEPWTVGGLDFWCKEKGVPGIDSVGTIEETGGWTYLVWRVLQNEPISDCDFLASDFCLPDDGEVKELVVRFAREVGSEEFSRADVWQWFGESKAFVSDEKKTYLLETLISLKVLRTRGGQVWLDRYLARSLKGE